MPRKRTIKPGTSGKKEGAAFAVWFRLIEQKIAALERCAHGSTLNMKEYLMDIAVRAIEQNTRAEISN